MQGSISKLRNVYGEASKDKFEDVKPHETTTEGSLIDANTHFVAVNKLNNFRFPGRLAEEDVLQFSTR